jgi:hypothetical protein
VSATTDETLTERPFNRLVLGSSPPCLVWTHSDVQLRFLQVSPALPVTTADVAPPLWGDGSPRVFNHRADAMEASFDVAAVLDEPGTVYYVVLPESSDGSAQSVATIVPPTSYQIRACVDGEGRPASACGSLPVPAAAITAAVTVAGAKLADNTAYVVYLAAVDASPANNMQASPVALRVVTADGGAPVFAAEGGATRRDGDTAAAEEEDESYGYSGALPRVAVVVDADGTVAVTVRAALAAPGKVCYLAIPVGAKEPTRAQVVAGVPYGAVRPLAASCVRTMAAGRATSVDLPPLRADSSSTTAFELFAVTVSDTGNLGDGVRRRCALNEALKLPPALVTTPPPPPREEKAERRVSQAADSYSFVAAVGDIHVVAAETSASATVTLTAPGEVLWMVLAAGSTPPASARVTRAARGGTDDAAVVSGVETVGWGMHAHAWTLHHLTRGSAYDVYAVVVASDGKRASLSACSTLTPAAVVMRLLCRGARS